MTLQISSSVRKDIKVLKLKGDVDINMVAEFDRTFEKEKSNFSKFALDMEEVDFIDSSGLGQVVKVLQFARQKNGTLYVFGLSDKLANIFKADKLNQFLQILSTREFNRKFPDIEQLEDLLKRA